MLVPLGKRRTNDDVVELLLECHGRIRGHLALARRLAEPVDQPAAQVAEAARQVARYFAEALPLHVADEEHDIAPRLLGRDRTVDDALATMAAEHQQHGAPTARLIELCRVIARDPQQRASVVRELAEVSARMTDELSRHLALEERVVLPALRQLSDDELAAIRTALRDRRERAIVDR